MTTPPPSSVPPVDGCAEARAAVTRACDEAHEAKAASEVAAGHSREVRRDLVAAQHTNAAATEAADPGVRRVEKAKAREAYELARNQAQTEQAKAEATAAWARAIDRINRSGRLAERELSTARAAVRRLEEALLEAERAEQTARIRAEQAEAACLDARVRLASCEEQAQASTQARQATVLDPHAATGGHAVAIGATDSPDPLVMEVMVTGDRLTLELTAVVVAEQTGLAPAQAQAQLGELVDAIVSVAAADGHLVFDTGHPFWSALTFEESRDVIDALARLGFQYEPAEGWHSGRSPSPMDLSMALAYAGLDSRNMREHPTAEDLRALPRSIGVDARGFLAAQAAALTLDELVNLLGERAAQLEPLWNEWGQIRPVLLSPRRSLDGPAG